MNPELKMKLKINWLFKKKEVSKRNLKIERNLKVKLEERVIRESQFLFSFYLIKKIDEDGVVALNSKRVIIQ